MIVFSLIIFLFKLQNREVLSQPKAESYIVPRASHKAVNSSACRDRKLLAIQQAES